LVFGIIAMDIGFGIFGAAWGWSLFWILQGVLFYPQMISSCLKLSVWKMIIRAYLPGIGIGLLVLVLAWSLANFLDANILLNLLFEICVCAIFGCIAIVLMSGYSGLIWNRIFNRVL
jgi:hypothetical protein